MVENSREIASNPFARILMITKLEYAVFEKKDPTGCVYHLYWLNNSFCKYKFVVNFARESSKPLDDLIVLGFSLLFC